MTDIVERLRAIDHMSVEDCFLQSYMFEYAAEEIERLREALEWYANPEVYKPSVHGLAFDRRDLSYYARAALNPGE